MILHKLAIEINKHYVALISYRTEVAQQETRHDETTRLSKRVSEMELEIGNKIN
jgi:hypothetical protein